MGEAIRTYSFWVFNLPLAFHAFFFTAYTFNIQAMSRETGMGEAIYTFFLPSAAVGVLSNFLAGWMSERVRMKHLLLVYTVSATVGSAGVVLMPHWLGVGAFIVGFGIAGGFFMVVSGIVWARFFGRKHLGAITGINTSSMMIGSAISPPLFALTENVLGKFEPAFAASVIVPTICIVLAFWADNPQRKIVDSVEE